MSRTLIDTVLEIDPQVAVTPRMQVWVEEAAHQALRLLRPSQLVYLSEPLTDTGNGVDVQDAQVVYAHVGGRRARRVTPDHATAYLDAGSIHAATAHTPVYYVAHGKAFVIGTTPGGTVVAAQPPTDLTIEADMEAIGWPLPVLTALGYYVAGRWREKAAAQKATPTLQAAPTPPSPPSPPAVVGGTASAVAPTATTIQALPTAPTMAAPSGREPTGSEVTLASITLPTPPTLTVDMTIPAAPSYSGPSALTLDTATYDQFVGAEDSEMAQTALGKMQADIEAFTASAQKAIGQFRAEVEQYLHEVQAEAEDKGLDVQAYRSDVEAYAAEVQAVVQTYSEEVGAALTKYRAEGDVKQAFQALELQAEQAAFEGALSAHQLEVQRTLQQAEIAAQEAAQTAQQETEVALQNAARDLERQLSTYQLELGRYEGQIAQYGAEAQDAVQRLQADLAAHQQALATHQARYEQHMAQFEQLLQGYSGQEG